MAKDSMQLITKMWAPLALEYVKFLNRYGLETIAIITGTIYAGIEMSVFADEEKYLKLTEINDKFNQEETQFMTLFDLIETLWEYVLSKNKDKEYTAEDYDEQEEK